MHEHEKWSDLSSEDEANYQVVEHQAWRQPSEQVDEKILRGIEKMGMVVPPKPLPKPACNTPPTPPETLSPSWSPARLPGVRITQATPQNTPSKQLADGAAKKGNGRGKKKSTTREVSLTERGTAGASEVLKLTPTISPHARVLVPAARSRERLENIRHPEALMHKNLRVVPRSIQAGR